MTLNSAKTKKHKYDYSLKNKDERAQFVEDKLGFILNMPPYMIMGYSSKSRDDETKYDRIPKLIEAYTTYYLESRDVESARNTEYSFYINRRDEMRRKTNVVLYGKSECFDGSSKSDDNNTLSHSETYSGEGKFKSIDFGYDSESSQVLKYAISKGLLDIKGYKKLLLMSAELLFSSKDEELKNMIEQIVFNCVMHCNDNIDSEILKEYITGSTLREISDNVGTSFSTVRNRINKILGWVAQN